MSDMTDSPLQLLMVDSENRHPWSHVVIGMWHKYPNPKCTHVVSIDVLDRSVDRKTGIIRTERVLACKQKTPTWIVKVWFDFNLFNFALYSHQHSRFLAVRRMPSYGKFHS